jgi:hypothetical protein
MNNSIAPTLTAFSLALLLLAGTAQSQYLRHTVKVTTTTPFAFTVEGKSVPAGQYSILCFAPARIVLGDWQGRGLAGLLPHPVPSARRWRNHKARIFHGEGRARPCADADMGSPGSNRLRVWRAQG